MIYEVDCVLDHNANFKKCFRTEIILALSYTLENGTSTLDVEPRLPICSETHNADPK